MFEIIYLYMTGVLLRTFSFDEMSCGSLEARVEQIWLDVIDVIIDRDSGYLRGCFINIALL